MTPVPSVTSAQARPPVTTPVMTPVMTPAPPMVPPPPGVMSPSSPPDRNPQVDEGHPANELLQPGRTRARTRAYHQASTSAPAADHAPHSADHALYNQPPPNEPAPPLPTFDASELSEPTSYAEAMQSPYSANWSHAMEREVSGLEEAGTFEDA